MNKKLQIFISSTYLDLVEERQAVVETLLQCGHIPAGMELFSANNKKQLDVIKKWIRESDIVFLVLGGRYGSIESNSKKSYIELEYNYAKKIGKKPIAFIMSDEGIKDKIKNGVYNFNSPDFMLDQYKMFKNSIIENRMCDFFSNTDELRNNVFKAIRTCEKNIDKYKGWISGNHNKIDIEEYFKTHIYTHEVVEEMRTMEYKDLHSVVFKDYHKIKMVLNGERYYSFRYNWMYDGDVSIYPLYDKDVLIDKFIENNNNVFTVRFPYEARKGEIIDTGSVICVNNMSFQKKMHFSNLFDQNQERAIIKLMLPSQSTVKYIHYVIYDVNGNSPEERIKIELENNCFEKEIIKPQMGKRYVIEWEFEDMK